MALTKISTDGVKDDAVTAGKIPANAVGTSEIADEAVTLAKLPHGTSSNNGKFLRANNGADPTFESLPSSGATLSGSTNNTVVTVTGANAMQGEANLTFDGSTLAVTGGLNATKSADSTTTSVITNNGTSGGNVLKLTSGGTGAGTKIFQVFKNNQVSEAEVFQIDGSGKVGIGTTSPGNLLHVKGSGHDKLLLETTGTAHSVGVQMKHASGDAAEQTWQIQTDGGASTQRDLSVRDATAGTFIATFRKGGGITFNGDTAAANALDDYETGTWTPVLTDATSGGNTYVNPPSNMAGSYVKVGNIVLIHFGVHAIGATSSTTNLTLTNPITITGLPFPPKHQHNKLFVSIGYVPDIIEKNVFAVVNQNNTHVQFAYHGGTNVNTGQEAAVKWNQIHVSSGAGYANIAFDFCYEVA